MSTVRLRRLHADYEKIQEYIKGHPRLQLIQADGSPPERYQLEYRIRGLRQTADELSIVKCHMVEVSLPVSYPRLPPQCRMLTPIFHPNIAPHAICIGDHWSPGEPLWSIVARIGEMIAYQSYNTKSPLNGEAARWVDQHVDELPLDPVSMMPDDAMASSASAPISRPKAAPAVPDSSRPSAQARPTQAVPPTTRLVESHSRPERSSTPAPPPLSGEFACPQCGALLKLRPELAGKQVRCLRCKTVFRIPLA
jgi:ubiquitin-protein ligase